MRTSLLKLSGYLTSEKTGSKLNKHFIKGAV